MANNRIFYAVQALGIEKATSTDGYTDTGTGAITWMKGVQSVGITTNFNLEQAYELGQLALYQNIENIPEIEVTAEKVLDGHPLLYLESCPKGTGDIVQASNHTAGLYISIHADTNTSASGNEVGVVYCSSVRPSNISYTFPVEGNSTESVTFVGNDKQWITLAAARKADYPTINGTTHEPGNASPTSGIFRRQHFINHDNSTAKIPQEVRTAVGNGKLQNVSVSVDLGRENIFELGAFRPYYKFTSFPVQTTCDFEVIALSGDRVNALGTNDSNLADRDILIASDNGETYISIDLGPKNKLTSVNYTGGDTGGGNATMTFSYQGFNYFVVDTGVSRL